MGDRIHEKNTIVAFKSDSSTEEGIDNSGTFK